jgi:hypothetical protein
MDNALELDTSLAMVEQHPGQALPRVYGLECTPIARSDSRFTPA